MSRSRLCAPVRAAVLMLLTLGIFAAPASAQYDLGDTLTVIQKPLLNIPTILTPGDTLDIDCEADPLTTGWSAWLTFGERTVPLEMVSASYSPSTLWWRLRAVVPEVEVFELYDLNVAADGGILDRTVNAVSVIESFRDSWSFIHVTDPHMPTHKYYYQSGADTDSTEMDDMREVIRDVNLIHPEFVLLTGDLVNEGELEDFLSRRYYSRAQGILTEFEVPVFMVAGNHDLGGWNDTPPPAGTARRDWWRFFGWKRLDSPPPGAPEFTQNYSFDYGPIHFTGLEAYDNYDMWRESIYGYESFTANQMDWLDNDLAAASGSARQVLFYHYDFGEELKLSQLGVELALGGHVHYDRQTGVEYLTDNVCDGDRAFRLVNVDGVTLDVRPTLSSGSTGSDLRISYSPVNDGTADEVSATVVNTMSERFDHALVKFVMPAQFNDFLLTDGVLVQRDIGDAVQVCYVECDLPPSSARSFTITGKISDVPGDAPRPLLTLGNHPNPFNPATTVSYTLSERTNVRLAIFDARGKQVALLEVGIRAEGEHQVRWNGRDDRGQDVSSGVYFARLEAGAQSRTHKLVLAR